MGGFRLASCPYLFPEREVPHAGRAIALCICVLILQGLDKLLDHFGMEDPDKLLNRTKPQADGWQASAAHHTCLSNSMTITSLRRSKRHIACRPSTHRNAARMNFVAIVLAEDAIFGSCCSEVSGARAGNYLCGFSCVAFIPLRRIVLRVPPLALAPSLGSAPAAWLGLRVARSAVVMVLGRLPFKLPATRPRSVVLLRVAAGDAWLLAVLFFRCFLREGPSACAAWASTHFAALQASAQVAACSFGKSLTMAICLVCCLAVRLPHAVTFVAQAVAEFQEDSTQTQLYHHND